VICIKCEHSDVMEDVILHPKKEVQELLLHWHSNDKYVKKVFFIFVKTRGK